MPRFEPFKGVRYAPHIDLAKTLAPPYDVLLDADAEYYRDLDEHNIVWIDIPSGGQDRYQLADSRLREWISEGVLTVDEKPSLTIYRMRFTDASGANREISGVLGGLEVVDEGAGGVLPHEQTTKKAKTDRLDLTRATATNLSPVWGLSLANGLTDALSEPAVTLGELQLDGVTHVIEKVDDPKRIELIRSIIGSDDVLIADGHHRYAISREYRDQVHEATGLNDSEAEFTLTFINELVEDQLAIEAIHRIYRGVSHEQLRADLASSFEFEDFNTDLTASCLAEMVTSKRLILLDPDGNPTWLKPREGVFDQVRELDGAWLEHALATSDAEPSYQHGLDEVLANISGTSGAVLIRPTSISEIIRTAREHLLMPPKSTFFTPKLLTGIVVRPTQPLPEKA